MNGVDGCHACQIEKMLSSFYGRVAGLDNLGDIQSIRICNSKS